MQYLDNHFLFSETFIKEYLRENKNDNDISNIFIQIRQWNEEYINGDFKDDSWFDFIDIIFDILDFKF